eukprot:jgi/Psemu1/3417/gm1.3417_g
MVGFTTKDMTQDKGNKSDEGNNKDEKLENNSDLKPMAKATILKEPGDSFLMNLEILPKQWVQSHTWSKILNWLPKIEGIHMQAPSQNGNNNKTEQNVQLLNYSLDVTLPKFPMKVGQGFAFHDIEVMLEDPDPEILYPIYQIVFEQYKSCDAYPGYKLFSQSDDGMGTFEWFPFSEVAPGSEQDCPINIISDLVQCYSEKHGNTSVNEKGSEYGSDNDGDTEVYKENEQY